MAEQKSSDKDPRYNPHLMTTNGIDPHRPYNPHLTTTAPMGGFKLEPLSPSPDDKVFNAVREKYRNLMACHLSILILDDG